jgi:polyhydroxybutyrate depolymerase
MAALGPKCESNRVNITRFFGLASLALIAACAAAPSDTSEDSANENAAVSNACGARTGKRGSTSRTLTVAGLHRTYHVYLPAKLDPSKAVPLVYVHHGYTMSGSAMQTITRYTDLADRDGFAVVFPDGQGGPDSYDAPWNVGQNVCASYWGDPPVAPGDDFAFLDAMRADIAKDQCIDADHVYLTGFSMGGYFAHHAGCERSDLRAVAPHSGGTHDLSACPGSIKPVIMFHGDQDNVIPPACETPDAWAKRNGCALTTHDVAVENGTCKYYDGCPTNGQVAICTLTGMGHCWAGGAAESTENGCPGWASATDLEWQFFKKYAW